MFGKKKTQKYKIKIEEILIEEGSAIMKFSYKGETFTVVTHIKELRGWDYEIHFRKLEDVIKDLLRLAREKVEEIEWRKQAANIFQKFKDKEVEV